MSSISAELAEGDGDGDGDGEDAEEDDEAADAVEDVRRGSFLVSALCSSCLPCFDRFEGGSIEGEPVNANGSSLISAFVGGADPNADEITAIPFCTSRPSADTDEVPNGDGEGDDPGPSVTERFAGVRRDPPASRCPSPD